MAGSVEKRRAAILAIIERDGTQLVVDLAERFNVSAVTLRRDVEELSAQGMVHRTHGSVSLPKVPGSAAHDGPFTIGMVVPHSNYYFDGVIHGATTAAGAAGAQLVLGVSDYDNSTEIQQVARLTARGVDGLIIAPTPDFHTGELSIDQQKWLVSLPVPMVLVERPVASSGVATVLDSVSSSHAAGAALAVRHLAELGHEKIACVAIAGPNTPRILEGYLGAVESTGLTSMGIIGEGTPGSDDAAAELIRVVKEGVTAVFVHNDQLAVKCMMWLEDAGISIPGDVSLAGYDDVIAALAPVQITAVAPWKREVGHRAVQRLLSRLRWGSLGGSFARLATDTMATEHIDLIPRLRVRQSTATPRKAGPLVPRSLSPAATAEPAGTFSI
ncbi:DNA-binding transcriptional regulator, LacI/PurR family [Arthrobacter alpinus]|uniref:DNA-binding transcriptional regulator, LacI/PurR family n=1 Tax=Arthrobacter alpinus TaxID=656366 RepID=A0A1H5PFZ6_9MICC|nr:substrate-binding domain-containing protein [Arthrobacter alpinus]SEF12842.1 DNA-binding transcriptional regulator, LacI/PurR family [Arthrobacter alpinus]